MINPAKMIRELCTYLDFKGDKTPRLFQKVDFQSLNQKGFIAFVWDGISNYSLLSGGNTTETEQTITFKIFYGMPAYNFNKMDFDFAKFEELTEKVITLMDNITDCIVNNTDTENNYNNIQKIFMIDSDIEIGTANDTVKTASVQPVALITLTCYFNE